MSKIKNLKPNLSGPHLQGYFKPTNPHKYRGNINEIIFRSSWEQRFMVWCDIHPNIKCWANETVAIPYYNTCTKYSKETGRFLGSWNNYYIDFFIQIEKNGVLESWLIEVKPNMQIPTTEQIAKLQKMINEGNMTAKKMNRYNYQLKTLLVNRSKFLAAKKFAEERGCKFAIVDENFLF